jgi:hypothetical protein
LTGRTPDVTAKQDFAEVFSNITKVLTGENKKIGMKASVLLSCACGETRRKALKVTLNRTKLRDSYGADVGRFLSDGTMENAYCGHCRRGVEATLEDLTDEAIFMVDKGLLISDVVDLSKTFRFRGMTYRCMGVVLYSREQQHCKTIRCFQDKDQYSWWVM